MFDLCVTNYHKLSGFKEPPLIISQSPWAEGPGTGEQWPSCFPRWSSGSSFKFMWMFEEWGSSVAVAAHGGCS